MDAQLQSVEIQPAFARDHQFAIEHATLGELRAQRIDHIGEIAVERLGVAALDEDFIPVAKNEDAEAVPLGLEDPVTRLGDVVDALGKHGQNRWIDRKIHRRYPEEFYRRRLRSPSQCASRYTPMQTHTAAVQRRRSTFS